MLTFTINIIQIESKKARLKKLTFLHEKIVTQVSLRHFYPIPGSFFTLFCYLNMELTTAIQLIDEGIIKNSLPQKWADLGAGKGLFTQALSSLLNKDSIIHAIDKDEKSLHYGDSSTHTIQKLKGDFETTSIVPDSLDGILMANSLHFIKNQTSLLAGLRKKLIENGKLIIVEYDLTKSSPWVPYPIPFNAVKKLALSAGFETVTKIGETPSLYNHSTIYAVVLS